MIGTGKNVGDLRRSNSSLILKLLYYEGAQSRKTLAKKASLTPAAVTILTAELMKKGYIIDSEITVKNGRAGRAEQLIDINYRGQFLVGLRLERGVVEIRIYDLGLACICQTKVTIPPGDNVDSLFEMLCDKIAFLMVNNNITLRNILGIGVTIYGTVDPDKGISVNSFGLLPDNTNIRDQIEKRLNLPVNVNNNVRSMPMAESAIYHRRQEISHLFIKYGPGLGAVLSINQQTYNGAWHRATELGHVVLEPDGELCRCGRRGCLETIVSYDTILREAKELVCAKATPVLHSRLRDNPLSIELLMESFVGGDVPIRDLFQKKFTVLAHFFDNHVTILDPQIISVCSDIFQHEAVRELFYELIRRYTPLIGERIVLNPDAEKTEQITAAALVIHSFLMGRTTEFSAMPIES